MARYVLAIALGLTFAAAGGACASLDPIDVDVCGNHVVESGEDCDGTPDEAGRACGAKDSDHACRFIWVDGGAGCPKGFVPSDDHRCRKSSFRFEPPQLIEIDGRHPQLAQIDGDEIPDLGVAVDSGSGRADRFVIHSLAGLSGGVLADIPAPGGATFGHFSTISSADVAVGLPIVEDPNAGIKDGPDGTVTSGAARGGLLLLRSRDGVLDPKVFTNVVPDAQASRFVMLPAWLLPPSMSQVDSWDLSILGRIRRDNQGDDHMCIVDVGCELEVTTDQLDLDVDVFADYDDRHLVMSRPGNSTVAYTSRDMFGSLQNPSYFPIGFADDDVELVGTAHLTDLNGDGLADIVALGRSYPNPLLVDLTVYCLFGLPNGEWQDGALMRPIFTGVEQLTFAPTRFEVAHVNSDAAADLVVDNFILLSKHGFESWAPTDDFATQYRWDVEGWDPRVFAVGDLDGDGADDFVGQPEAGPMRYVFGGDDLPLVRVDATTTGRLTHASVTDFNGDGAGDVLASFLPESTNPQTTVTDGSSGTQSCLRTNDLVIAFGNTGAFPDATDSVGTVPEVLQIVSGRMQQSMDGFGDYAFVSDCTRPSGLNPHQAQDAVVLGNAVDLVSSPFVVGRKEVGGSMPVMGGVTPVAVFRADALSTALGDAQDDVVVFGRNDTAEAAVEAYLLPTTDDAALDNATARRLPLPDWWTRSYSEYDRSTAPDVASIPGVVAIALPGFESDAYTYRARVLLELVGVGVEGFDVPVQEIELPVPTDETHPYPYVHVTALGEARFLVAYGAWDGGVTSSPDKVEAIATTGDHVGAMAIVEPGEAGWIVTPVPGPSAIDAVVLPSAIEGDASVVAMVLATDGLYKLEILDAAGQPTTRSPELVADRSAVGETADELVSGDFNQDGLADLLLVDGRFASVLLQEAVNP